MSDHFSAFPSCFRPTSDNDTPEAPPPPISGNPNLTTCLYHTDHGLFNLTWSRTLLGRSLHLHLDTIDNPLSLSTSTSSSSNPLPLSTSAPSFHLHIKPFLFWKKHGSKKLFIDSRTVHLYWDLRRAKFGSRPEPISGFYVAVVIAGEMTLLAGDSAGEAYARTRAVKSKRTQTLLQRREHVFGNRVYRTNAEFGGRAREITIESNIDDNSEDPRLIFSIDDKRVLEVKHLRWKFRGNERIEVDGVSIQVSWDVYNWLFDDVFHTNGGRGHALFMFRFEKLWFDEEYEEEEEPTLMSSDHHHHHQKKNCDESGTSFCGFGMSGFERKKMNKKSSNLMKTTTTTKGSFSSSSMSSSASSGCSSSVLEWASMEEKELESTSGFSLLVYAWKS